jgi:hypothetical protein
MCCGIQPTRERRVASSKELQKLWELDFAVAALGKVLA